MPTIDQIVDDYLWLQRHGYIGHLTLDGSMVSAVPDDTVYSEPADQSLAREILAVMVAAPNGLVSYQVVEAILGREVTLAESEYIWMRTDAEPEGHA